MDTNDFIGSFAQENVLFQTTVVKQAKVGDNFWKAMIFVENDRFVTVGDAWTTVPGSSTIKALTVTANDYADHTTGLLRSWLYDLFCNGFTGDCILVACAAKPGEGQTMEAFNTAMEDAYKLMKAYAYHKTVCAGGDDAVDATTAVALATLCAADKGLLSSAPYLPYTTATPGTPASDTLYNALATAGKDVFMCCHADATRNGALYSLGKAMSLLNGSSTCVGSSFDTVKSSNITPSSGIASLNLDKPIKDILKSTNIQFFKTIGNNTGDVAAVGAETIMGDCVPATWILAYITYMTKVSVAELITEPNFLKNASNYSKIVGVMSKYLNLFGPDGSGRLEQLGITAPSFAALPEAKSDQIIIDNAWSAKFVDQVRDVQISGTLYIGA